MNKELYNFTTDTCIAFNIDPDEYCWEEITYREVVAAVCTSDNIKEASRKLGGFQHFDEAFPGREHGYRYKMHLFDATGAVEYTVRRYYELTTRLSEEAKKEYYDNLDLNSLCDGIPIGELGRVMVDGGVDEAALKYGLDRNGVYKLLWKAFPGKEEGLWKTHIKPLLPFEGREVSQEEMEYFLDKDGIGPARTTKLSAEEIIKAFSLAETFVRGPNTYNTVEFIEILRSLVSVPKVMAYYGWVNRSNTDSFLRDTFPGKPRNRATWISYIANPERLDSLGTEPIVMSPKEIEALMGRRAEALMGLVGNSFTFIDRTYANRKELGLPNSRTASYGGLVGKKVNMKTLLKNTMKSKNLKVLATIMGIENSALLSKALIEIFIDYPLSRGGSWRLHLASLADDILQPREVYNI